jgi:hypothetical protein
VEAARVAGGEPAEPGEGHHLLAGGHDRTVERADGDHHASGGRHADPAQPGHLAGEHHPASGGRAHRRPERRRDVDAAMPRPVRPAGRLEPADHPARHRRPQRRHLAAHPGRHHRRTGPGGRKRGARSDGQADHHQQRRGERQATSQGGAVGSRP